MRSRARIPPDREDDPARVQVLEPNQKLAAGAGRRRRTRSRAPACWRIISLCSERGFFSLCCHHRSADLNVPQARQRWPPGRPPGGLMRGIRASPVGTRAAALHPGPWCPLLFLLQTLHVPCPARLPGAETASQTACSEDLAIARSPRGSCSSRSCPGPVAGDGERAISVALQAARSLPRAGGRVWLIYCILLS